MLNELAQGLRPMSQGTEWFDALGPEEQSEALLFLRHQCVQARAVAEDGPSSCPDTRALRRPAHRQHPRAGGQRGVLHRRPGARRRPPAGSGSPPRSTPVRRAARTWAASTSC
ncbi:DUF5958 family protein [Streptomyces sp. NBC_01235]|uniref:DUF5958 family protein n=1 Tax=Streptomyces sp. NBC_01235 TaxID=2903788 RepID=UPI003FA3CD69